MTRHFQTVRTLLAACLLALFAPAALAAQGVTTGFIRGQVTDENGNPLAGAQVGATNTATSFRGTAVTGADGTYTVRLLPPGTYRVTASQLGRASGTANVQVVVGAGATANLRLTPEAVAVTGITATAARGSNTVDATEGGVQEAVSREQIENLPSLGRDFTDFINLSGLVAPDPGTTTGGQFSIAGQRASQTNLLIDGVDANNSFFGENRGGARIPFAFSLESIREFQIITNGYDVEYGSYSGGVVNVVTRGGTNKFEGTAYGNYRSDALTGKNFEGTEPVEDYSVTQYSARVSGPIKRDKAFFLLSLDGQRRREPQLPVTLSRYAPGGAEENAAVFTDIQRFFNILETKYGVNNAAGGYTPFQTSNDVITLFGRVDLNLGENNRLTLRHNYSNYTNGNEFDAGFDFIYGLSRAEQFRDRSHSFVGELQSILGGSTFNTLRFQFADEARPRNGNELRPALIVNLTGGERIGYGGTFVSFQNDLDERKLQVIDNLTHVAGDHTLKVGGNLIYTRIHNQFISNGAGEYSFANLDAFEAFNPTSY
ncbi:MAG TPA: TonB-dependent receptor, partial [Longimicrobium sp.]|nr:TonB-dependent receptor [Longimicrobium sp.]